MFPSSDTVQPVARVMWGEVGGCSSLFLARGNSDMCQEEIARLSNKKKKEKKKHALLSSKQAAQEICST